METTGGTALTDEGRQAKLDELLAGRFRQRGKLHLPTTTQYNSLNTNDGLLTVCKDMCRWLGVKPNGLQVVFGNISTNFDYTNDTIIINQRYKSHPYAVGAFLALATVTYFVQRYNNDSTDRLFIEYAALHSGLGIWVLNALQPKTSRPEALYTAIDGRWFHTEGISLQLYSSSQFASQVASFAHSNRIAPESYLPQVSPRSRHLLPALMQTASTRSLSEPDIVVYHRREARRLWTKIWLVVGIFALVTTVGVYYVAQRKPSTDPIQIQARQSLDIIKESVDACVKKASDQQSSYDPNDLFMTRQIDATKSRCESQRNQYNYALGEYRDTYTK